MHVSGTQRLAWQPVIATVQSPLTLHSTHWPALGPATSPHTLPPPSLHAPAAGLCTAVPPEQLSLVHTVPSLGTSLSSLFVVVLPAPSQTTTRQSPAVCVPDGMPAATGSVPQVFASHVACSHALALAGQSAASLHW